MEFEFEFELATSIDKASGGFDDFRIVAHYPCEGDPEEKEFKDTKLSLPQKCAGYKGSWKGDPHIMTFDGLKYDCQGSGEFVIMKSVNSDFAIQGRFVKFIPDRKPTVTKSVVITAGSNVPTIQINVPSRPENGLCKPFAYLDGERRDITGLERGHSSFQADLLISGEREGVVIYIVGSKVQVTLWAKQSSMNGCVLATTVCLSHDSPLVKDNFVGLLGTPNGDVSDDWMAIGNTGTPIPGTVRERLVDAYNYCVDNWCIRDEAESLFTYDEEQNESFDAFEDCGAEGDKETIKCVEKEQANPNSELSKICGDEYACLVDGCIGNWEDAQRLIDSENEEVDYGCAEQVEFEDFGHNYAGGWGLRAEQDSSFGSPFLRLHKHQPEIIKDIIVPQDADLVTLEFNFYEIDQWEVDDQLLVYINDIALTLGPFGPAEKWDPVAQLANYYTGGAGGISWKRYSLTEKTGFGFNKKFKDQIHFVSISIPKRYLVSGFFRLKLEVALQQEEGNESGGFDDIRVMALRFSCEPPEDATVSMPVNIFDLPEFSLPVTCRGEAASIGFDISTFDNLDYSCRGEGEFVLARSQDSSFEVQGRFVNYHPSKLSSVPRGVVVRESDAPTIQINVAEDMKRKDSSGKTQDDVAPGQCPLDLYVDQKYHQFDDAFSTTNIRVERVGEGGGIVVIYYPLTGVQVTAMVKQSSWLGCYLVLSLCLPDDYRPEEEIIGLLGSRDSDKTNDWMDQDGRHIMIREADRKFKKAYSYCTKNWCLEDAKESLFTYADNESFQSFSRCSTKYNQEVDMCMRKPPFELKAVCGASTSCLNAGCSGDLSDAMEAVNIENDLLEHRCGDLIAFEDFNDGNARDNSGWKEVSNGKLVRARRDRNGVIGNNQFLGRLSREQPLVMKKYKVPKTVDSITIELTFFELDNWAGDGGRDTLYIILNDYRLDLRAFDEPGQPKFQKIQDGIMMKRESLAKPTNMGFNQEFLDQSHKVVIDLPQRIYQRGFLKVVFEADLSLSELMESAGIDNFRMTAHRKNCRVTWTGTEVSSRKIGKIDTSTRKNKKNLKPAKKDEKLRALKAERELVNGNKKLISIPARQKMVLEDAPSLEDCRSAYAFHSRRVSTKFEDMGFVGQFGWSSGPIADSNFAYMFDIYAEAASSIERMLVGTMTVDYNGVEVVLTVDSFYNNFYPKDIHAFAGTSRLPNRENQDIIDPSHFPITYKFNLSEKGNAKSKSNVSRALLSEDEREKLNFVVSGFDGDAIFIVAHMTVCGDFTVPTSVEPENDLNNPSFRGGAEQSGVAIRVRSSGRKSVVQDKPAEATSTVSKLYEAAFAKIRKYGF